MNPDTLIPKDGDRLDERAGLRLGFLLSGELRAPKVGFRHKLRPGPQDEIEPHSLYEVTRKPFLEHAIRFLQGTGIAPGRRCQTSIDLWTKRPVNAVLGEDMASDDAAGPESMMGLAEH